VGDVVQELLAEVAAARKAREQDKQHSARVRELLVVLRQEKPDMTLPEIEDLIERFYERASISRYTAHALPDRRTRKRRLPPS
jgi:hypothetical protein